MNNRFYLRLAVQSMKKNGKLYIPYFLTVIGSVMMAYIMSSIVRNPGFAEMEGGGSMVLILLLGNYVISFFLVFFLFYTNSFLMNRRKQEFGVFQVLGMEKKHLARMICYETLLTFGAGLGAGLALGFLLTKLFTLILYRLMDLTISWDFSFVPDAAFYCVKLFAFIFAAIFLHNLWRIYKLKPVEMIQEGKAGEREPRGSLLLTAAGIICLGGAYYLSITTTQPTIVILVFFAAVILVIIGTFCLFTVGSITILKLLRKNKAYYYKTKHFISVSGMMYRMKQNAAGLSIICILSTAVLVMLSSTVTLYAGMDDVMNNRFIRDFIITVYDYSEDTVEMADEIVNTVLTEKGLFAEDMMNYRNIGFSAIQEADHFHAGTADMRNYSKNLEYLYFMPLEDYNRLSKKNEILQQGEVLALQKKTPYGYNTFSIFGRTFDAIDGGKNSIPHGFDSMGTMPIRYVVLPDMETMRYMDERQAEIFGEYSSSPNYYIAFNADCGRDEAVKLYEVLESRLSGLPVKLRLESAEIERGGYFALYGGMFFVGIFLGTMFIMATVLIIYYKQVSEGYEDRKRYEIMQNVGLSEGEIKDSIKSQVMTMFFLPLMTAAVHIGFAFPMIVRLLAVMNLTNVKLFVVCTAGVVLVFAFFYNLIYRVTSRVYYQIVKR